MIRTQSDAKRFFVDKILAQARADGMALSAAERRMLSWSESDPEFVVDPRLVEQLESELSDEAYEQKIVGLLARSFTTDAAASPEMEKQWKQAAEVLHQGDHSMLVMLEKAIGRRQKRWWQFW